MYSYAEERSKIFTDEGQRLFVKMRDTAFHLCNAAGAVRMQEMMKGCTGDTWAMLACADRMVELGDLVEVEQVGHIPGQYRIFRRPHAD